MQVLHVGAAEGSAWSAAAGRISVLCVRGVAAAIPARPHYGFNLQTGKQQLHPSPAWDGDPRSLFLGKPQSLKLLEVVAVFNIS